MDLLETNFEALVDEEFYLTNNTDVQAAVESGQFSSGTEHFTLYGRQELRQPVPGFDEAYYLSDLPDSITASEGAEMILALESNDMVIGMGGDDFLNGNLGDDVLSGNQGNDTVRGGQGNDMVWGGKENDLVFGDKDSDTLWGDLGHDEVLGGIDDDLLFGNIGNDILNGNQGEDTLYGGQDNDIVRGGQQNDWLFGDKGSDTLFGDKGADTLTGGSQSDRFAIGQGTGGLTIADADYITDFTIGEDLIQLNDGLNFQQLNILAGTDEYEGHAIIQNAVTGEYLAILRGIDSSAIAVDNFLAESFVTQTSLSQEPRNRSISRIPSNFLPQDRDSNDSTDSPEGTNNPENADNAIGTIGTGSNDNADISNNPDSTDNADDTTSIDNRSIPDLIGSAGNSDNTDNSGNSGNSDNSDNTGTTDSASSGNSGDTDNTGTTDSANNSDSSGNSGDTDNTGTTDSASNSGNTDNTNDTGASDSSNSGNSDNTGAGNTDNSSTTDNTDNTGATNSASNSGNTDNTGATDSASNSDNTGTTDSSNSDNTDNTGATDSSNSDNTDNTGTTPVNNAPTEIALSNLGIAENSANNTIIGTLSSTDLDAGDTHTYELVDDGGGRFAIDGDRLTVANGTLLDFETNSSHAILVRVTDTAGNIFDKGFVIAVNNINEAPTVANTIGDRSATQDAPFNFTIPASTFKDIDGNTLTYSATLTDNSPLPSWLTLDSATGTFSGTPTNSDIGNINIKVTADDGNGATIGDTFEIAVNNANDAPTVTSLIRTGTEDADIVFSAADFTSQFSDIDGDRLAKIKINNLPGNGTLKLSGTVVSLDQEINVGDLGNLSFTPDANFNGNTSFDWTGHDGTAYAAGTAKVILDISNVNDAPTVANVSESNNQNTEIAFNIADFTSAFSDVDGDSLAKIKVTSLPSFGTLKLGGTSVTENQEIDVADLNNLSFTPLVNFNGSTSFGWNGFDGTTYAALDGTVNINAEPAGTTLAAAWDIGTLEGNRPFNDAVGATDPNDYYKFALNAKSNFRVAIDNLSANADIQLLDSSGNVLEFSARAGTVADVIATPLDAGTYYVRVLGTSDTDYNLVVSSQSIATTGTAYYVSADGNDSGAGTFDNPFKTIQKAANLAQAGDAVYIRGATYRENVIPQNSGTAGAPITFTAYANEEVTTSGTELITGWTQHDGNIYKAQMNWDLGEGNNQIFVNGQMMVEARWPNIPDGKSLAAISRDELAISDTGGVDNDAAPAGTIVRGNYTDSDLDNANFADNFWASAKINTIPGWNWTPKTGTVVSNSNGSIEFDFPYGGSEQYVPQELNSYYLWGKYEALDTAKEWYYDSGTLYLWSPNGDAPSNYTVEAKQREWAWEILQKDYINLENINVFGAGIKVWRSNNVVLDEIDSQYGVHQTLFDSTSQVWEGAGHSIAITDGSNNNLKNSSIAYSSGSGIFVRGTGHKVTNSVVRDVGYSGANSAAIDVLGDGHEVVNNTLFGSGSRLINLRPDNGSVKVLHNELYAGGRIASDFGAIIAFNTDGFGSEIAYNSIHNMQALYDQALNFYGSAGIILELSKNYEVHHNVIYNTSIEGFKYYDGTGVGPLNVNVKNNTIDGDILFSVQGGTLDGAVVENNIFSGSRYLPNAKANDIVLTNNLETSDFSSIFADSANRDYQLKTNIDQGAIAFGQEPWIPGAVVSGDDLYSLDIQADAPQNGKISGKVVGLDIGNKLPEDFQVIIGNAPASGKFSSTYFDPTTNLATVTFADVEVGDAKGVQPIFVQIGNNDPIYLGKTINLG